MNEITFDEPGETQQAAGSDFFTQGSPSCRFTAIGDSHQGVILEMQEAQQRTITDNKPAFWPDGNPKQMLVVTLQTNERDAEIEDDDGQRRLYINKPSGMFAAIKAAVGKEKFMVGGTLAVKYVKNGKPKQAGFSPPKEYQAKYLPPGASANGQPKKLAIAAAPMMTFNEACSLCLKAGIARAQLLAALKNAGIEKWTHDAVLFVEAMIKDKSVNGSAFDADEGVNKELDPDNIPF